MRIISPHCLSVWTRLLLLMSLIAFGLPAPAARTVQHYPDAAFFDGENDDRRLLVMIAGLKGRTSWDDFIKIIADDQAFDAYDVLTYDTPQSQDIEAHVDRIATLIRMHPSHEHTVFVGHSIGGIIIKRYTLRGHEAELIGDATSKAQGLPDIILTYGTPLDTDKFSISFFKRAGARIFWPFVEPLKKEVFNIDRLEQINEQWRAAVEADLVRHISVFGVDDKIAPTNLEEQSQVTVFIHGDHVGILSSKRPDDCPFLILRAVIEDRIANISKLDCIVGMQTNP